MDEDKLHPVIRNCTFYNNGDKIYFKLGSNRQHVNENSLTFTKCNFTNNNNAALSKEGIIILDEKINAEVNIEECTFDKNTDYCIICKDGFEGKSHIYKCTFENNY